MNAYDVTPEALARLWHEVSGILAPRYRVPARMVAWEEMPRANQRHLVATAAEVLARLRADEVC